MLRILRHITPTLNRISVRHFYIPIPPPREPAPEYNYRQDRVGVYISGLEDQYRGKLVRSMSPTQLDILWDVLEDGRIHFNRMKWAFNTMSVMFHTHLSVLTYLLTGPCMMKSSGVGYYYSLDYYAIPTYVIWLASHTLAHKLLNKYMIREACGTETRTLTMRRESGKITVQDQQTVQHYLDTTSRYDVYDMTLLVDPLRSSIVGCTVGIVACSCFLELIS